MIRSVEPQLFSPKDPLLAEYSFFGQMGVEQARGSSKSDTLAWSPT